jgi:hypothetical protein
MVTWLRHNPNYTYNKSRTQLLACMWHSFRRAQGKVAVCKASRAAYLSVPLLTSVAVDHLKVLP